MAILGYLRPMWQSLFHFEVAPLQLFVRASVVFISVLILLRISGKRQLGQMGATEFVAILLISNAVQNSMNGGDNSLIGGLLLAIVLIVLSTGISFLTYRSRVCRTVFEGTPTLLIHNGVPIEKALLRERLPPSELHTLLRKQGVHHFSEVRSAILESDGTLSLIRYSDVSG
jgi:uncharacterized membrane protein YcaP (DUF421 family)